jgi:hypothetical protein
VKWRKRRRRNIESENEEMAAIGDGRAEAQAK